MSPVRYPLFDLKSPGWGRVAHNWQTCPSKFPEISYALYFLNMGKFNSYTTKIGPKPTATL